MVCLFEWFATVLLSAGSTEALFDTLFSMYVLSGRGDGTEQRKSKNCILSSAKNHIFELYDFFLPLLQKTNEVAVALYVRSTEKYFLTFTVWKAIVL